MLNNFQREGCHSRLLYVNICLLIPIVNLKLAPMACIHVCMYRYVYLYRYVCMYICISECMYI